MAMTAAELKAKLHGGLLSFPVTDMDSAGNLNVAGFRARVEWLAGFGASAHFIAGGAGEFFSLEKDEYAGVVETAVSCRVDGVPVIAATGFGTRTAISYVREAERLGADGILLLPPYLTEASQEGLLQHIGAVCRATRLGVIVYNRANCRLTAQAVLQLTDSAPNFVALKDGVGDFEQLLAVRALVGERLAIINGMPTAEIYAPAFKGLGIGAYSSAIFNFLPQFARAFHAAIVGGGRFFREPRRKGVSRSLSGFAEATGWLRG